jgi:hypothetical protein
MSKEPESPPAQHAKDMQGSDLDCEAWAAAEARGGK